MPRIAAARLRLRSGLHGLVAFGGITKAVLSLRCHLVKMFARDPLCVIEIVALAAPRTDHHFTICVRPDFGRNVARAANNCELSGHERSYYLSRVRL